MGFEDNEEGAEEGDKQRERERGAMKLRWRLVRGQGLTNKCSMYVGRRSWRVYS